MFTFSSTCTISLALCTTLSAKTILRPRTGCHFIFATTVTFRADLTELMLSRIELLNLKREVIF